MNHCTTRAVILPAIIELVMDHCKLNEKDALDLFYRSATGAAFSDDETGLYSQSPLYIFGLLVQELTAKE